MDSSTIELKGSEVASIELETGRLGIHFSRAYLLKSMTGSAELTRWWQPGSLMIEGAEVEALPSGTPLVCAGGELEENIYTYRDMIPVPFESRGHIRCALRFEGIDTPMIVTGHSIKLLMRETPRYIEHLRAQPPSSPD